MGTTLTGTTPQDTYDSLIKVTDNGPLSGSLKVLTDGLGNNSTLSLSTTAASIAGTLSVTGNATFDTTTLFVDAANDLVGIGTIAPALGKLVVKDSGFQYIAEPTDTATFGYLGVGHFANGAFIGTTAGTNPASDIVRFGTAGVERVRVTSNGLTFNGDTAAANALDDYEEGTFTATLAPSDSGSISLNPATCTYTKIGRQVVVKGLISISSVSTPAGASVTIGGLPFTIINSTAGRGSFSVVILDASAGYTAATYPTQHTLNATSLIVYVNASTLAASDEIMFTVTYFV